MASDVTSKRPAGSRLGDPAAWWPDAATLAVAGGCLGVALLVPRLVPDTDPYGVDPYSVRLAVVVLVPLAAAAAWRALRPALPVLVAMAAVVLPFVLWAATVDLLADTSWLHRQSRLEYRNGILVQDAVYLVATAAVAWVAIALVRRRRETPIRLRVLQVGPRVLVVTLLLVVGMALVTLAIPAQWLGRVALPLGRLRTDMPLLGPAYVLQAAAQELAFRGVLLGTLERSMPPWMANSGQALLFGLAHIAVLYEGPTASIVPLTVAIGLALGWVTQRTGSIWPAVVAHAVIEVGQGYLVLPGLYGF